MYGKNREYIQYYLVRIRLRLMTCEKSRFQRATRSEGSFARVYRSSRTDKTRGGVGGNEQVNKPELGRTLIPTCVTGRGRDETATKIRLQNRLGLLRTRKRTRKRICGRTVMHLEVIVYKIYTSHTRVYVPISTSLCVIKEGLRAGTTGNGGLSERRKKKRKRRGVARGGRV